MAGVLEWLAPMGVWLAYAGVALLCLAGVALSCLSISGSWLVAGAALCAHLLRPGGFPGWVTIVGFLVISGLIEVAEGLAGTWGVKRRGGSRAAGWLAMVGGILGLFVGAVIPIPFVGSLIGMLVCSFALVYVAERRRLRETGKAVDIAMGAVIARVLVVALKVGATLGMSVTLLLGLWLTR